MSRLRGGNGEFKDQDESKKWADAQGLFDKEMDAFDQQIESQPFESEFLTLLSQYLGGNKHIYRIKLAIQEQLKGCANPNQKAKCLDMVFR